MACVKLHSEQIGIFSGLPITHLSCRLPVIENSLHEQASINTRITRRFWEAILRSCQRKLSNIQKIKKERKHTCTECTNKNRSSQAKQRRKKKMKTIIKPYLNVSLPSIKRFFHQLVIYTIIQHQRRRFQSHILNTYKPEWIKQCLVSTFNVKSVGDNMLLPRNLQNNQLAILYLAKLSSYQ